MTRKRIMMFCVVFALVLGGSWLATSVWSSFNKAIRDAYAVWAVAALVIEHLETHDGAWPKDWEDLRNTCASRRKPFEAPEFLFDDQLDDLRARVAVDWAADPDRLAETAVTAGVPPFRVIWLRNGKSAHWQGQEPNQMIYDYLHARKRNKPIPH